MSDIPEAIGTVAEGGLFSRAVEPNAGETGTPLQKGHFSENSCLNCGTALAGNYCHACGQKAHLHRTLGAFLHDLLHGALHLDGKTWRTLPLLAFKPGQLTRRYIEGERARFVSPMALFLFSIFLMFAVFQLAGISTPTEIETGDQVAKNLAEASEKNADLRAGLEAELNSLPEDSARRKEIEAELADLARTEGFVAGAENVLVGQEAASSVGFVPPVEGKSGVEWIDTALEKWRKNPGLMLYKLQANFYKFSWLLIPLSTPFVWLLFAWKRRFKAYDHAIFITYSLSFVSLLFVMLVLAALAGVSSGLVITALLIIPPLHMYKQLRHAYGLSRYGAVWRLAALMIFIVVVLLIFLQLLVLMGLMG